MQTLTELNQTILHCRQCPRLVAWREQVAREKRKAYKDQEYWGKPVPGFGDPQARVFVVGLAPGAHGSNRTGRQFTGDASGDFLYPALYRAGFANQPESCFRGDGLVLTDMYLAAAARCAPPGNKPTPQELANCQPYLECELELIQPKVIVALGRIAFESVLRIFSIRNSDWKFAHGAYYRFSPEICALPANHWILNTAHWLLASYHPSQQNTLTGRLTVAMFDEIWCKAKAQLRDS
ncbi:MAG: type-5 uracil-DNA glycosylase [Anaerolineales bacterium]